MLTIPIKLHALFFSPKQSFPNSNVIALKTLSRGKFITPPLVLLKTQSLLGATCTVVTESGTS